MGNRWAERDRKLSTRLERKKMGGRFKQKEVRNKARGRQRKLWNTIRKFHDDELDYDSTGE